MLAAVGYATEDWHDLFVASAGAGAALAGLVFVAVSINIDRILKLDGVPERALQTVTLLVGVVVVSILGLAPQSASTLGAEVAVWGLGMRGLLGGRMRRTLGSAGIAVVLLITACRADGSVSGTAAVPPP